MASQQYAYTPITRRLSTDITDTESVVSQGYSDLSESSSDEAFSNESVSDFAGYIDNSQHHLLRRRQAQLRLDNTLHDAQVRMQGVVADGGALFLETMDYFEWLWFNTQVTLITIAKLLSRFFWWLLDIVVFYSLLLVQSAYHLCGQFYKQFVFFFALGFFIQLLINGYKGIVTYACHNSAIMPGLNASSTFCSPITHSSTDLADLTTTNDAIIAAVCAIKAPFDLSLRDIDDLMTEAEYLAQFVEVNKQDFTDGELVEEAVHNMRDNVAKVSASAHKFEGDYRVQRDNLIESIYQVLYAADDIKPHTTGDRFRAEMFSDLLPFVFTRGPAAGNLRKYAKTATKFEKAPETSALFNQHGIMSASHESVCLLIEEVRQEILEILPAWKASCDGKSSNKQHCMIDPQVALDRFDQCAERAKKAVDRITTAHGDHQRLLQGLTELRTLLTTLFAEAQTSRAQHRSLTQDAAEVERVAGRARRPVEPAVARAILYEFATRLRGGRRWLEIPSDKKRPVFEDGTRRLPVVCGWKGKDCRAVYLPQ